MFGMDMDKDTDEYMDMDVDVDVDVDMDEDMDLDMDMNPSGFIQLHGSFLVHSRVLEGYENVAIQWLPKYCGSRHGFHAHR